MGADPRGAAGAAEQVVRAAHRAHDGPAETVALRAQGLALRELADPAGAERALRRAIACGQRTGAQLETAEAQMTYALVLLDSGRTRAATRQALLAGSMLSDEASGRLMAQRALLLQRCGQLTQAFALAEQALTLLERDGDLAGQAIVHNNRGIGLTDQGRLAEARADLDAAVRLYKLAGRTADVMDVRWNRAMLAARGGDVPSALAEFEAVSTWFATLGQPVPQLAIDRGTVLLDAGLVDSALADAERAVSSLQGGARGSDLAEAMLLAARCHLATAEDAVSGSAATNAAQPLCSGRRALELAQAAARLFQQQHRPGWATRAAHLCVLAEALLGASALPGTTAAPVDLAGENTEQRARQRSAAALRRSRELAKQLAAHGWQESEREALIAAAGHAVALGRTRTALELLDCAAAGRAKASVAGAAGAWYALAAARALRSDRAGTWRALERGLATVEAARSLAGCTEMQVGASRHAAALTALGSRVALESGSASRALQWAARTRAVSLQHRPALPPNDGPLAQALVELRRLAAELEAAAREQEPTARLLTQQAAAENRVLALTRASRTSRAADGAADGAAAPNLGSPRSTVAALSAALAPGQVLLHYLEHDGQLALVTLGSSGPPRLVTLGPRAGVLASCEVLGFALRRLARGFGSAGGLRAAAASAYDTAATLSAVLLPGIKLIHGAAELVVVPSAALHSVPWSLLPGLARRPLVVAPSAPIWLSRTGEPKPQLRENFTPGHAVAGPTVLALGPGLAGAEREIAALADVWPGATVLAGANATAAAVLGELDGAHLAHLACHGRLRTDNPQFSALMLADGPLTVYDLQRLRRAPDTVVLSACSSGVASTRAGDEVMGLVSGLLAQGTRRVVATLYPIPDEASIPTMTTLHRHLRAGLQPARALAQAVAELDPARPADLVVWAAFTAFGS